MSKRSDTIKGMLAKDPSDVFLTYSLGMELAGEGRHQEAAEVFARCIELDGQYLPAYVESAKSLRSAGDRDGARGMFHKAMALATTQGQQHVASYVRQQLEGLG